MIKNDKPIEDAKEDYFQRYAFAKRIAQTIDEYKSDEGFVTAIYGKWGEGKTSVLKFIEVEFEVLKDSIIVVHFNPWRFGDEASLIKIFFESLAKALEKNLYTRKERFFSVVKKPVFDNATALLKDIVTYGKMATSFIAPITDIAGKAIKSTKGKDDISIDELKARIEDLLIKSKRRIVVLMDDIDRLDADEIRAVFRLVKLTGNFKYVNYILAFDEIQIATVLAKSFGDSNVSVGISYLEKIVQVPLRLPLATRNDLHAFCMDKLAPLLKEMNLSAKQIDRLDWSLKEGVIPAFQTPRLVLRFINACSFSSPLMMGLVDTVDLMLIEALKLVYPKVYDVVWKNKESMVTSNAIIIHSSPDFDKEFKDGLTVACEQYSDFSGNARSLLIALFPEMVKTFGESFMYQQPDLSEIDLEMRVCSKGFFDRYFTYSVLKGDISDVYFMEQLEAFKENQKANENIMSTLFKDYGSSNVIYKIDEKKKRLSEQKSLTIIKCLISVASNFPRTINNHIPIDPATQAANLIVSLLKQLDEPLRSETMREVVLKSNPTEFGFSILSLISKNDITNGIFQVSREEIESQFLSAMQSNLKDHELIGRLPLDTRSLLYIWNKKDSVGLASYIEDTIKGNRDNLLKLLKAFTPYMLNLGAHEISFINFREENFKDMKGTVPVDLVAMEVISIFGGDFSQSKMKYIEEGFEANTDEILVTQFMALWTAQKSAKAQ